MKCNFVLKKEKNVFFFCQLHSFFVTLCVKKTVVNEYK